MVSRGFAIASLVVIGVIIADILTHPQGTSAALGATQYVTQPAYNALLGQPGKQS
jgi:hypothetical protein